MPEIFPADIFINGNSGIQAGTSDFEGFLVRINGCEFKERSGPLVWIKYLAGKEGGERMGEITFDWAIDSIFRAMERITRKAA